MWVAIGGRGSLIGAFVGAVVVNRCSRSCPIEFQEYWPLLIGCFVVVVILFEPAGLVGTMQRAAAPHRSMRVGRARGGVEALRRPRRGRRSVSLRVEQGEIRCLVGPNGAGKTTLFNMLAGSTKPELGAHPARGRDVTGSRLAHMSRLGVARKYQSPSLFDEFTVRENLATAADGKRRRSWCDETTKLTTRASRSPRELGLERLLDHGGQLSHGHRQWLEIGMMLINDPQLLLLDEPTAGMTRDETASDRRASGASVPPGG